MPPPQPLPLRNGPPPPGVEALSPATVSMPPVVAETTSAEPCALAEPQDQPDVDVDMLPCPLDIADVLAGDPADAGVPLLGSNVAGSRR